MHHLETTEVVLIRGNTWFFFVENFNSEFSYIEVWFPDKNSKRLEIEKKIRIKIQVNT